MKNKNLIIAVVLSLLLSACGNNSNSIDVALETTDVDSQTETEQESTTELNSDLQSLKETIVDMKDSDYYTDYQNLEVTSIQLDNDNTVITGNGAVFESGKIIISKGGNYVLSGTLEDGQILISTNEDEKVTLYLNGVTITSKSGPAILEEQSDKLILSLVKETINQITDSENYDSTDDWASAIYAQDSLTINGEGSLKIQANYKDGIVSKDILTITNSSVSVNAKDDGILGRDGIVVAGAVLNLNVNGDGIKTTNEEDSEKGSIYLEDGTFSIQAGADGIQSSNQVRVVKGSYAFITEGKGFKALQNMLFMDGAYTITSTDDAIHSNHSVAIMDGTYEITAKDDGIHGDAVLEIAGGVILIHESYEGLEAETIAISGGNIELTASDDGLNAAGGNDASSLNGRSGQNSFEGNGIGEIIITGGNLVINANGDGVDSNGTIIMSGGTVLVSGPENDGNGILDYGTSFIMTGGQFTGSGSSGMYQSLSEESNVYVLDYIGQASISAGTFIRIYDGEELLYSFTTEKTSNAIIFASDKLVNGTEYTIEIEDETYQVTASTGTSQSMGFGNMGGFDGTKEPGNRIDPGAGVPPENGVAPSRP